MLPLMFFGPLWPKGGQKTQSGRFPTQIVLCLKKVCYKVSLCENYQRQSCNAFIGLTIRAKTTARTNPFLAGRRTQHSASIHLRSVIDIIISILWRRLSAPY